MNTLNESIKNYMQYCSCRKRLDSKSIRAYRIDLAQYATYMQKYKLDFCDKKHIGEYIEHLHSLYAPRTVKRKVACLRAFYHYLMCEESIRENPFHKLDISFKIPQQLPRYIPIHTIQTFYEELYAGRDHAHTPYQFKCSIRNIAVVELLFATGLRISELCMLPSKHVNLVEKEILICGKGNKERILQLTDSNTINAVQQYSDLFSDDIEKCGYFFVNGWGNALSDQSVRNMINKLVQQAAISLHITPHMFRHSFATCLVNQDVDIRCIQELMGHSSIKTTEIYTHVSMEKQKNTLQEKNPRKLLGYSYVPLD